MNQPFLLIISALACYRLALMISSEKGPYAAFQKLRSWLKREAKKNKPLRDSQVHLGITCIKCDSVWIASAIASYIYFHDQFVPWFKATGDTFLLGMALSSAVIIIHRMFPSKS